MQINCTVTNDVAHSYSGKKGAVTSQRLTLLDIDPVAQVRFGQLFDYDLTPEETTQYGIGKLLGKNIVVGVTDWMVFGGRFRARGKIISVK